MSRSRLIIVTVALVGALGLASIVIAHTEPTAIWRGTVRIAPDREMRVTLHVELGECLKWYGKLNVFDTAAGTAPRLSVVVKGSSQQLGLVR
jgi:hypothetical protein